MVVDDINLDGFTHGQNLYNKAVGTQNAELLAAFLQYKQFRRNIAGVKVLDGAGVRKLVHFFNAYRGKVVYTLEKRAHSAQENMRSTMLEELFVHLFLDLVVEICDGRPDNLYLGKGNGYVDLTFSPVSFRSVFTEPNPYIHSKNQDFLLGAQLMISIGPNLDTASKVWKECIVMPVVAIECKTYLERNMLDSCAGTASRLKKATPYCLYIIASEYLKLEASQPELTDIDEVFVLCKASNAQRLERSRAGEPVHPIDGKLVVELFEMVHRHLNRIWWKPEDALKAGRVIHRPS